jgi:hypothetical protein
MLVKKVSSVEKQIQLDSAVGNKKKKKNGKTN